MTLICGTDGGTRLKPPLIEKWGSEMWGSSQLKLKKSFSF
nr:MAG TPA: hypothetical protein [Caudoviricetes sp.]